MYQRIECMKVVIMAGGKGTRISSVASDIPKPMIKVEGVPVLEREIECLKDQGFDDIIMTVSHLGNIIMDYFGDGSGNSPATGKPFGVHIEYYFEKEPLGNAGALFKIKDKLTSDFLLLNADAMFDVDFNRFVAFHRKHDGLVTLFTHPNSHPYDSGLIIANKDGSVEKWLAKEDERPQYYRNRVNAGLHVINPKVLELVGINADEVGKIDANGKPVKVDLDRQLLKPLAGTGKMFCYDSPEYVKDMGTPERYYSVCKDCKEGKISAKNLKNKQKAIFLDRDGTINKYVGFLRNIDDFELIDGVAEAIRIQHYVVAINVDVVMKIENDSYLKQVVDNADMVLVDGKPLVWISKLHGRPLKAKISGSDLVPLLCEVAAQKKYTIFIIGGKEEVAEQAKRKLEAKLPGIQIVGTYAPPFGFEKDEKELDKINQMISDVHPDLLIACLGCPKQEKWIYENIAKYDAKVSVCAGATVDFLAGNVKRAPKWMSEHGFEWFYRFLQEPKRMFKRYFIDDFAIIRLVFKYWKVEKV